MNTTHPHLLMAQNRDQWQRLQKEAAQDRLLKQIREENRTMKHRNRLTETTLITWRRYWQHLLVVAGVLAALLMQL